MVRARLQHDELPVGHAVVEPRVEADVHGAVAADPEADAVERQRQPVAARLHISLLQGPVGEEAFAPVAADEAVQLRGLRAGEKRLGERQWFERTLAALDVDTDVDADYDGAGDETVGVRQVEAQAGRAGRLYQFGTPASRGGEPQALGIAAGAFGEHAPHERACHQVLMPMSVEAKLPEPSALAGIEQRLVAAEERRLVQLVRKGEA